MPCVLASPRKGAVVLLLAIFFLTSRLFRKSLLILDTSTPSDSFFSDVPELHSIHQAGNTHQNGCSCYNINATIHCCDRSFRRAHKMGFIMTQYLFHPLVQQRLVTLSEHFLLHKPPTKAISDYRQVIMTRNWYDALISGYIYHKAGRECDLDKYGRPMRLQDQQFWPFNQRQWDEQLLTHHDLPLNNRNNRTLCQILKEEPTEVGMQVYMDAVLGAYYMDLVQLVLRNGPNDDTKTLFVCYERLMDPATKTGTIQIILDWLFPSKSLTTTAADLVQWLDTQAKWKRKGHSVRSQPAAEVEQLLSLVKQLDEHVFHSLYASVQSKLGCRVDETPNKTTTK